MNEHSDAFRRYDRENDDGESLDGYPSAEPLANRVSGDTMVGCLGLTCIMSMLLLLGVSVLGGALWVSALGLILAFGLGALGLGLLTRTTAGPTRRSHDPRQPRTHSGEIPIVERPASLANHLSLALVAALGALMLAGYMLLSFDPQRARGIFWGPIVMAGSGAALIVCGGLVRSRRLPTPAIQWVRAPILGHPPRQWELLALAGAVGVLTGIMLTFFTGVAWGFYAIVFLFLALSIGMIGYSFARRSPQRWPLMTSDPGGGQRGATMPHEPHSPNSPFGADDPER